MLICGVKQSRQPIPVWEGIGVQQSDPAAVAYLSNTSVVASSKTCICFESYKLYGIVPLCGRLTRPIAAGIIYYDYFSRR
jgi:hypothetical protein